MDQFYFSVSVGENKELCLAPLTNRRIMMAKDEVFDASGYFLFEKKGVGESAEVSIIARAVSEEAAFQLRDMFKMS